MNPFIPSTTLDKISRYIRMYTAPPIYENGKFGEDPDYEHLGLLAHIDESQNEKYADCTVTLIFKSTYDGSKEFHILDKDTKKITPYTEN